MATQLIDLVNGALARVGGTPIAATDYDNGTERHHLLLREAFDEIWQELVYLKGEDLRQIFEITTYAGQAAYSLGFDPLLLSDFELWITDPQPARFLKYDLEPGPGVFMGEEQGTPSCWYLQTKPQAGVRELRFFPVPDATYTVHGWQQIPPNRLAANELTTCNELGDLALKHYLEWALQVDEGFGDSTQFRERFESSWSRYLGHGLFAPTVDRFAGPFQHRWSGHV